MTDAQEIMLRAVVSLTRRLGVPPTVAELSETVGLRAQTSVRNTLNALRRKGLLTWQQGRSRSYKLTEAGREALCS